MSVPPTPDAPGVLRFKLGPSLAAWTAKTCLRYAQRGEVPTIHDWEVLLILHELLTEKGLAGELYREEGDREVTYSMVEWAACVKHGIECRPLPPANDQRE